MDPFHWTFERIVQFEIYLHDEIASRDFLRSIVCGGISGIAAKTVIAPIERVKISFQITNEKFSLFSSCRRGLDMIKNEGILSLWKGHSTTIARIAPFAGISYATHDYFELAFKTHLNRDKLPAQYKFLAGSIGGFTGTIFTYPLDVLRVRLAFIPNISWLKAVKQGNLFHGILPTLLGVVPYSGMAWCTKETLHEIFPKVMFRKPAVYEAFILNAIAGLCGQFVTYPLDIVRRRMQMEVHADRKKNPDTLKLSVQLQKIIQYEGLSGLFKGFTLNIFKGPISLSISLTTYDMLKKWLEH